MSCKCVRKWVKHYQMFQNLETLLAREAIFSMTQSLSNMLALGWCPKPTLSCGQTISGGAKNNAFQIHYNHQHQTTVRMVQSINNNQHQTTVRMAQFINSVLFKLKIKTGIWSITFVEYNVIKVHTWTSYIHESCMEETPLDTAYN
jgi:hypothetical protein